MEDLSSSTRSERQALSLTTLPLELFEEILSHLPTPTLLHISPTCRQIHASATYLTAQRFRRLSSLAGDHLIFECSPPSVRRTTPYHTCTHTGTHPLKATSQSLQSTPPLGALYAHFTPPNKPTHILPFEANTYFTQLITAVALLDRAQDVPSIVGVIPETVVRVRRSWLREAATKGGVVWVGEGENVGIRMGVREVGSQAAGVSGRRRREVWMRDVDEGEGETGFEVVLEEVVVRMGYLVGRVESAGEEVRVEVL